MTKSEDRWLLSAECFTDKERTRVELADCPVTAEDAERLLNIIREQDVTGSLQRYKEPKLKFHVLDETTYYSSICFADGELIGAATLVSKNIESYFYRLAEKYGNIITETK